jgi:nucleoside-diphosphate-sugar epimerase
MRIAVLGGTVFIGRATVADLVAAGHDVLVVHRGQHEPTDLAPAQHAHIDRHDVGALGKALDAFEPDAVIDCLAMTARDADEALIAIPGSMRLVVLSSMDVYRAFAALHAGVETDPLPIEETSPVRPERYPYRGKMPGADDYEKLDVEDRYLWRGATILRLPMVFGEHDGQRREEPILRRLRAGRTRIPIGTGTWLWTRGYVGDIARGIRLAVETDAATGEVFNLGERRTATIRTWLEQIVAAAGIPAELVRVPDDAIPPDLGITEAIRQHLLVDSSKAEAMLGWRASDPAEAVRRSVVWHLANPPSAPDADFSADDGALASLDR